MSLTDDVAEYEAWLRSRCDVVEHGLTEKHAKMAESAFRFYRATCFRFARTIPILVPELCDAPETICVGDPHIENWGTWRDGEGRLVWGVNDFDDAALLPYTFDLLRLAASALLAPRLPGGREERVAAILRGYRAGLANPRPCFVDDRTPWMLDVVQRPAAKKDAFRQGIRKLPPAAVAKALRLQLPEGTKKIRFFARQKGGGGLGRPRYVARGRWRRGMVVREAKALVPSSWDWAYGTSQRKHLFLKLANGAYRAPDPFLDRASGFIIRRIAADSEKIDLATGVARAFGPKLFAAMGADLAAIHLAGPTTVEAIRRDLRRRETGWLLGAAEVAEAAVRADYREWVRVSGSRAPKQARRISGAGR